MSDSAIHQQARALARQFHRYPSIQVLEALIERAGGAARAEAVFGAPIRNGDTTVVPVARVRLLSSLGSGSSRLLRSAGDGGGGAAAAHAEPVGYLLVGADGAAFHPIRRPAAAIVVPLAALTAVVAVRIVGMSLRAARHRRKMESAKSCSTDILVAPPGDPGKDTAKDKKKAKDDAAKAKGKVEDKGERKRTTENSAADD